MKIYNTNSGNEYPFVIDPQEAAYKKAILDIKIEIIKSFKGLLYPSTIRMNPVFDQDLKLLRLDVNIPLDSSVSKKTNDERLLRYRAKVPLIIDNVRALTGVTPTVNFNMDRTNETRA